MDEARKNDEIISLASSQVLRWIDELNGNLDADNKAADIKREIKSLKKHNPQNNKKRIRELYKELDKIQFKPDYLSLIIDKNKHYYRACKGFKINGIKYVRLLGTNGGIKNSTIIFVSERLHDELDRRIENGRDPNIPLVPAKLEAYRALACSASIPVSLPNGIAVVDDAETKFFDDIISLSDEQPGEPVLENVDGKEIILDANDGCGIMLPSLAERWSKELGLDYVTSGVNTRFPFSKGMVFTFDFIDFAEKVAGTYYIRDAWGNLLDVRQIELVLTTSMLKLWDSYKSFDDYLEKTLANGYSFGITKVCPKRLENERALNYQFIQCYHFTDDDIKELIKPTLDTFKDVLDGDWRKSILFLRGTDLNDNNVEYLSDDYIKAIMIDQRVLDDPFVQSNIYSLIKNRINMAKVGVLNVHGNYSIVSADPYITCQKMFGLEQTGLLKRGEIYNKYWSDYGAETLACYRAPMTSANNIRKVHPANREDVNYWYRYMNACTIFNAWDTSTAAMNGMDFDGDLVMLTDNKVLVERLDDLRTIMCVQRKAEKKIPKESDMIASNIASFGNEIGQITNRITSMFEVQSHFDPGSIEYETLDYRIKSGQQLQQNSIDKSKGIISKPMPRSWHDRHAALKIEDDEKRKLYYSIVADKKPYFMRYIYPALMNKYNTYIRNTDKNAMREFQMSVKELKDIGENELTERQKEFLRYFELKMPVGTGDCIMNKICRIFEKEFDGYVGRFSTTSEFDYTILKSGTEYTPQQYNIIKHLCDEYNKRVSDYKVFADYERIDEFDSVASMARINKDFKAECDKVCPDEKALCDIVLDICYNRASTKRFAWNMCGSQIIDNLLSNNDNTIHYPALDASGDIYYGGETFSVQTKKVEVM